MLLKQQSTLTLNNAFIYLPTSKFLNTNVMPNPADPAKMHLRNVGYKYWHIYRRKILKCGVKNVIPASASGGSMKKMGCITQLSEQGTPVEHKHYSTSGKADLWFVDKSVSGGNGYAKVECVCFCVGNRDDS
jgi:hypothetical protein